MRSFVEFSGRPLYFICFAKLGDFPLASSVDIFWTVSKDIEVKEETYLQTKRSENLLSTGVLLSTFVRFSITLLEWQLGSADSTGPGEQWTSDRVRADVETRANCGGPAQL
jgi:hypothetical protein